MNDFLWGLIPWGYNILLSIEHCKTPFLDYFFSGITFIGSEWFYILFLPIIYWSINKELGLGLSYASLFSTFLNDWLKNIYAIPRPDDIMINSALDKAGIFSRLNPLFHEESPSWPSNHSQSSVVFWGYLANQVKKAWFWIFAMVMAGLVAFSRLYGGVHFPQDVFSGILFGLLILCIWLFVEPRIKKRIRQISFNCRIVLVTCIPFIGLFLVPSSTSAMISGTLIVMGIGYQVEKRHTDFQVGGPWHIRVLRCLVGLVILLAIYLALKVLFSPITDDLLVIIFRMIRYSLVSLSVVILSPMVFIKYGLALSGKDNEQEKNPVISNG